MIIFLSSKRHVKLKKKRQVQQNYSCFLSFRFKSNFVLNQNPIIYPHPATKWPLPRVTQGKCQESILDSLTVHHRSICWGSHCKRKPEFLEKHTQVCITCKDLSTSVIPENSNRFDTFWGTFLNQIFLTYVIWYWWLANRSMCRTFFHF